MANEIVDAVRAKLGDIIQQTKDLIARQDTLWGKMTVVVGNVPFVIEEIVKLVEKVSGALGADKRDAALDALDEWYMVIADKHDMPGIPNIIEPFFDKMVGLAVRSIAGLMIDMAVKQFNDSGVFSHGTS